MTRGWSTFWVIIGGAMLIIGFWYPWFMVDFGVFKMNIGWFPLLAGIVGTYYGYKMTQSFTLTPRELHDYGQKLTEATPMIVSRLQQGMRPKELATEIEQTQGIPALVTLKFMLALSHHSPDLLKGSDKPKDSDVDGKPEAK